MVRLVIVDGQSDKGVVEAVAKRLGIDVEVLMMRGNNPEKASRLANSALARRNFDKVIILKDQHNHPEQLIRQQLSEAMRKIGHQRTYPIIVRKAIEAWILAGMGIGNAEDIDDPADHLNDMMRKRGRIYVKSEELTRKLVGGEEFNMDNAMRNSRSFKEFVNALRDP